MKKIGLLEDEELNEKRKQGYCADLHENAMVLHAKLRFASSISSKSALDRPFGGSMKRYFRFGRIAGYLCNTALLIGMVAGLNGVMKAQTDTGRVEGTVKDQQDAVVS